MAGGNLIVPPPVPDAVAQARSQNPGTVTPVRDGQPAHLVVAAVEKVQPAAVVPVAVSAIYIVPPVTARVKSPAKPVKAPEL